MPASAGPRIISTQTCLLWSHLARACRQSTRAELVVFHQLPPPPLHPWLFPRYRARPVFFGAARTYEPVFACSYRSESSRCAFLRVHTTSHTEPAIIPLSLPDWPKPSQETERLVADPAPGITASPHEDNLRYFDVTIQGPDGSPFQSASPSPSHTASS